MNARRPAVFLDRDGTLIEDSGFLDDPKRVVLLPDVVEALRLLERHGFARIVVTNQSGVARGYFDEATVDRVNARVVLELMKQMPMVVASEALIDGFYTCPHYDEGCDCRKPAPGLIHRAVADHGLDLAASFMVGDRGSDIALASGVGIPGILVPGPQAYDGEEPSYRANGLLDAAQWIVAHGH